MNPSKIVILVLLCFLLFAETQCTTNHLQSDFEKQALSPPSGIQAMTSGGEHKPGSERDPSDWRTAPDFSGLFEVVTPAYPNPVFYNSQFNIQIYVKPGAIHGLYVYAFRQPGNFTSSAPLKIIQHTLKPGLHTIILHPQLFAQGSGTGNFGNIYRIIFLDGRQRIITYGDVQVK